MKSSHNDKYYFQSRPEVHAWALEHLAAQSLILDIGCASGAVTRELKKRVNFEAVGIDVVRLDTVNELYLEHIIHDLDLGLPKLKHAKFNLVFALDILEHLKYPEQILLDLRDYLESDSRVIVSLPNFINFSNLLQIIKRRSFQYEDSGILDRTHLRFFSKTDAEKLIQQSGFKIYDYKSHVLTNSLKGRVAKLLLPADFIPYQNMFLIGIK